MYREGGGGRFFKCLEQAFLSDFNKLPMKTQMRTKQYYHIRVALS